MTQTNETLETLAELIITIQNLQKQMEILNNRLHQFEVWRNSHISRPENPHNHQLSNKDWSAEREFD